MFKRPARRQTYEDFVTPARQHEYDGARDMDDARVRSSWPGCQLSLEQRGSPAVTEACLRAPSPGIDLDQSSGSGASRAAGLIHFVCRLLGRKRTLSPIGFHFSFVAQSARLGALNKRGLSGAPEAARVHAAAMRYRASHASRTIPSSEKRWAFVIESIRCKCGSERSLRLS
jgi:hypothetical protein